MQTKSVHILAESRFLTFRNSYIYGNKCKKERLKQFIDTLNISEREFCRRIGVSSSYVMSIKKSIQPDKMQAISIQFLNLIRFGFCWGRGNVVT